MKDVLINADSLNERKRFTNFLPSSSHSSEGYLVEVTFQRSDNNFTPLEVTSMKECKYYMSLVISPVHLYVYIVYPYIKYILAIFYTYAW